jgi:hypothetical protein
MAFTIICMYIDQLQHFFLIIPAPYRPLFLDISPLPSDLPDPAFSDALHNIGRRTLP